MRIYLLMRIDADISDPHHPTYVGYSAILSDNAEVDADIRIRMAIPAWNAFSRLLLRMMAWQLFDLQARPKPGPRQFPTVDSTSISLNICLTTEARKILEWYISELFWC